MLQMIRSLIERTIFVLALCIWAGPVFADQATDGSWKALADQYHGLNQIGQHAESLKVAKSALALAEAQGDRDAPKVAMSLIMVANSYSELNQLEQALKHQQRAINVTEKMLDSNHPDLLHLLNRLAGIHQKLGQYDEAIRVNLRILGIREKNLGPNDLAIALSLNNLADNYRSLGLYDDALPLLRRSVAIFEKTVGPESTGTAIVLNNLSAVYRDLGEYEESISLSLRAFSINKKVYGLEHRDTALTLNYLGSAYRDLGELEKALPLLLQALEIDKKILGENHPDTAQCLNNLANVYTDLAQWDKALTLVMQSLQIHENIYGKKHPTTAVVLNNFARIYTGLKLHNNALPLNERALKIHEDAVGPGHPLTAQSLNILANTYSELGFNKKALPLNERALSIFEKTYGEMHPEVGQSLIYLGATLNGLHLNERALVVNQRAVSVFESVLGSKHRYTALSLNNLATNYANAGQPEVAIVFLKEAVNSYQGQRERISHIGTSELKSYTAAVSNIYHSLASLLVDKGRLSEAQSVLDMLKEEEQFDFIRRGKDADPRRTRIGYNVNEQSWMERYRQIANQLGTMGAEEQAFQKREKLGLDAEQKKRRKELAADLRIAQKAFDTFLLEIRHNFARSGPARSADLSDLNLHTVNGLQNLIGGLGHDAVLLQYYVTEDRVGMMLTTPGVRLARSTKISSKDLFRQIAEFRRLLRDPKSDPLPASRALYEVLIAPVVKDLEQAGARTVMLSLDGALRYLPFGALHDGQRYLVERWNLPMYTSVTKDRLQDPVSRQWQVAGLGVSRSIGEFPALPAVKAEMSSIVDRSNSNSAALNGEIYLDEAFTALRLKDVSKRPFQLLHVASHFRFSPGTEVNSFLLLGDGQHLTLGDIRTENYRFDNVDLLTLSACDTGLGGGRDAQGREIEGFGVIAQQQGAKAVLATLWPVADKSTAALMVDMYRSRQDRHLTKAEALRQAQISLMNKKRYTHPFYWAPFILMGNWL